MKLTDEFSINSSNYIIIESKELSNIIKKYHKEHNIIIKNKAYINIVGHVIKIDDVEGELYIEVYSCVRDFIEDLLEILVEFNCISDNVLKDFILNKEDAIHSLIHVEYISKTTYQEEDNVYTKTTTAVLRNNKLNIKHTSKKDYLKS